MPRDLTHQTPQPAAAGGPTCQDRSQVPSPGGVELVMLTREQLATMLQVDASTVDRMRTQGLLPEPAIEQRRADGRTSLVRWSRTQVLRWIDAGCPAPAAKRGRR